METLVNVTPTSGYVESDIFVNLLAEHVCLWSNNRVQSYVSSDISSLLSLIFFRLYFTSLSILPSALLSFYVLPLPLAAFSAASLIYYLSE